MPVKYSTSAALLFTEQELGGPCTETETTYTVGNAVQQIIAQGNGDRVGLLIINTGVNNVYFALAGIASATNGIPLIGGGSFFICNVRDDFTLPSRQFTATSAGGSSTIYVLEIVRFRPLEDN